jgi:hypothetical protein
MVLASLFGGLVLAGALLATLKNLGSSDASYNPLNLR